MFTLQPLPYGYNALEPFIDEETMHLHHDKHHQAYVDNLNKALETYPEFQNSPVESILQSLDKIPEDIRQKRNLSNLSPLRHFHYLAAAGLG